MKEVRVYIPSKDMAGKDLTLTRLEWCDKWAADLSRWFGGATTTVGQGSWLDKDGNLVMEQVSIISAYASEDQWTQHRIDVRSLAEGMKYALYQESVLYSLAPADMVVVL